MSSNQQKKPEKLSNLPKTDKNINPPFNKKTNNPNNYNNNNQNEFTREQVERNMNEINDSRKTENSDIFNKLYVDSYRKQNKILLNEEIKKLSELGTCTFKPSIRKYNFDEKD